MKIKRFYCSTEGCNKSFRSEEKQISHTRSHTKQEESQDDLLFFQCDICLAQFPTKRSVSAHKRIHRSQVKSAYTKKIISTLTARLMPQQKNDYQIPQFPYSLQDIILPPITIPTQAILPSYNSLFTK
ncbi:hypothetical protein SteCoe_15998 [Stentor coeruleus]|uniref:C2H2-type domain-containing protein n=1 Tax=Stentor coeruleus TaxID=5963 RepID=A0A1R2C279_9CILI|nr:hypothetical protein SteCoe_15998 [Stentor coeruleus]